MQSNNLSVDQMRKLLALVLITDKQGVINLLTLNGIDVGTNTSDRDVTIAFLKAIKDSQSFRDQTATYLEAWVNAQKQSFLGRSHYGFIDDQPEVAVAAVTKTKLGGQPSPGGKSLFFVDDIPVRKIYRGGQPVPGGHIFFVDDAPGHKPYRGGWQGKFGRFVNQPRDIIDFAGDAHSGMRFVEEPGSEGLFAHGFAGDKKKKAHIKRNFVQQPRDIMDFVDQPQDIMAFEGIPQKVKGGFLREDGPTVTFDTATDDSGDDTTPIATQAALPGLENPDPGYTGVGTVVGPSQVTLQQITMTPAQIAAANQQAQATGVTASGTPAATPAAASSGSFLGGLFSASNVSAILKTGLNAYSTNLTASANNTSEQNALKLEQYKLAQEQQAGINADTSVWPAWATVVIAVAAIGGIAIILVKMHRAKKARLAAAG